MSILKNRLYYIIFFGKIISFGLWMSTIVQQHFCQHHLPTSELHTRLPPSFIKKTTDVTLLLLRHSFNKSSQYVFRVTYYRKYCEQDGCLWLFVVVGICNLQGRKWSINPNSIWDNICRCFTYQPYIVYSWCVPYLYLRVKYRGETDFNKPLLNNKLIY